MAREGVKIDPAVLVRLLEGALNLHHQTEILHRQAAAHFRELQAFARDAVVEGSLKGTFGGTRVMNFDDAPDDLKAFLVSMFGPQEVNDKQPG